jgi:hypothetical protein
VPSSVAKNLAAIVSAIDHHAEQCPFPPTAVALHPFEIERLDWDEIRGLPIVPDSQLSTGIFRILCDRDEQPLSAGEATLVEAVASQL